jgi:F-box interacting protein
MEISIKCDCATYGFGYDSSMDNYKAVAVFSYVYGYGVPKAKIMVHTLGTNSWRMIDGDFPVSSGLSLKYVSDTLNWLEYIDNVYYLVSFDLVNESYRKFSPPNYGVEDVDDVILGVLKDCLCISGHTRAFSSVWMMKEYGNEESWIKLYSVPYMNDPFHYGYTKPIWISEDDQVLMECKSWHTKMNLIVYGVEKGTFKIPNTDNINGWITPVVCIESLVSPCF